MISIKRLEKFCCEDISNIENYDKAIADETTMWHCHHRFETDKNMSAEELINADLYYNRPANELILLTPSKHKSVHVQNRVFMENVSNKLKEIFNTDEYRVMLSQNSKELWEKSDYRKKMNDIMTSEDYHNKMSAAKLNRIYVNDGVEVKYIYRDELPYYLDKGFKRGRKIRKI